MLNGYIKDDKPILPIEIGWSGHVQNVLALVDTGFTGELKIPPSMAEQLGIQITDTRKVVWGDGRETLIRSGFAYVSMEGTKKPVSVLIDEGTLLAGTRLFKNFGYTMTIDFPNEQFELERRQTIHGR